MKTTLLSLVLAISTLTGFAQGRVSIANDSTRLFEIGMISLPGDGSASGPIQNQALPGGHIIVLALYAGTTSGSMALQTSYALTGANWLAPGRGATKALTLTGVPGGVPQFFNIILTDNSANLPNTIDGAFFTRNASDTVNSAAWPAFGATYFGSSGLFQFTPSTSAIAAPLLTATGTTWAVGSVYITGWIPEPSSVALFGLGAGALMLSRNRPN